MVLGLYAYVVQKWVQIAKCLISEGRALAEVSHVSGFADQSHMTRHFVGVTLCVAVLQFCSRRADTDIVIAFTKTGGCL